MTAREAIAWLEHLGAHDTLHDWGEHADAEAIDPGTAVFVEKCDACQAIKALREATISGER